VTGGAKLTSDCKVHDEGTPGRWDDPDKAPEHPLLPGTDLNLALQVRSTLHPRIRCILGDIRLWVGDPLASFALVSSLLSLQYSQVSLPYSQASLTRSYHEFDQLNPSQKGADVNQRARG